jgi:hypothetical protein
MMLNVMIRWHLPCTAACVLLAGCGTTRPVTDQELADRGYWYHDGTHMGGSSGHASPQAIYNATHGTWLWPPTENSGKPGG